MVGVSLLAVKDGRWVIFTGVAGRYTSNSLRDVRLEGPRYRLAGRRRLVLATTTPGVCGGEAGKRQEAELHKPASIRE